MFQSFKSILRQQGRLIMPPLKNMPYKNNEISKKIWKSVTVKIFQDFWPLASEADSEKNCKDVIKLLTLSSNYRKTYLAIRSLRVKVLRGKIPHEVTTAKWTNQLRSILQRRAIYMDIKLFSLRLAPVDLDIFQHGLCLVIVAA